MRNPNPFKKIRQYLNVYGIVYFRLPIWKAARVNAIITLATLFIAILFFTFRKMVGFYLPGLAGNYILNLIVALGIIPFVFTVAVIDLAWCGALVEHILSSLKLKYTEVDDPPLQENSLQKNKTDAT